MYISFVVFFVDCFVSLFTDLFVDLFVDFLVDLFVDVFVDVFAKRFFRNTHSVFRNPLVYSSALEQVGLFDLNLENYWDWDEKIR